MYPRDVVAAVWGAWPPWLKADPKSVLPGSDIVLALVDVAYQASLQTEEGRGLSFRIAHGDAKRFEDENGRLFPAAIPFDIPRSFTANEVVRLAPAIDPTRMLIGVDGDVEHLRIWGIADTGAGRFRQLEGDLSETPAPDTPESLIITVFRSGELRLSYGDTTLVELAAGEIVSLAQQQSIGVLGRGPVADVFADARARFLALVEDKTYDPPLDRADVMQEFGVCLERLLLEIRAKQHGGAILVVPSQQISQVVPDVLTVKYPCRDQRLWLSLGANLGAKRNFGTLAGFLFPKDGATAGDVVGAARAVSDRGAEIADVVSFVASLSSVDGAIVLTDDLQLFGFGAIVLPGDDVTTIQFAADDLATVLTERRADEFGTRHRSTFRFCAKVPDAVAFVVSQDGDVKAAKSVAGRVSPTQPARSRQPKSTPGPAAGSDARALVVHRIIGWAWRSPRRGSARVRRVPAPPSHTRSCSRTDCWPRGRSA